MITLKVDADSYKRTPAILAVSFVFVKMQAEVSAESMKKKHFSFPSLPATIESMGKNFDLRREKDITRSKLDTLHITVRSQS